MMNEKHLDELLNTIRYHGKQHAYLDDVEKAIIEIKEEILK